LGARLDLLGRAKYLGDLGIRRRFDDTLREDLRKLLERLAPEATDAAGLIQLAARHQGTNPELLERAIEKLGLAEELRKRFPAAPTPEPPF
jgi:hypothetical protein